MRSIEAFNTLVFGLFPVLLIAAILYAVESQRDLKIPTSGALAFDPAGTCVEQKTVVDAADLLQGNDLPQQALVKDMIDGNAPAGEGSKTASEMIRSELQA